MTDVDDDYEDYDDDRYDDDYEPSEPDFDAIAWYEHMEHMDSLSPLGRAAYEVRHLILRRTWAWQMKMRGRWLVLTGRADTFDEPPF